MTPSHDMPNDANIVRLNAFLDQFEGIDPDFDDVSDELECQLAEYRHSNSHN